MKIQLKHVILNYEMIGSGEPLIFLHGNGEDLHIYDELARVLKHDFKMYLIDSRNHGHSSKHQEIDYDAMTEDIYQFITTLNLIKPYLFGFSDGGIIGLKLAIKYPDLIGKMIIAGANLSPKGFRLSVFRAIQKYYVQSQDPLYDLMLTKPNILFKTLEKIKTPTLILAGEFDMIRYRHTLAIHHHIKDSKIIIVDKKNHDNYIVHQTYVESIVLQFFK